MAEKIKKSIPWFLILLLIGLAVGIGLNLGKTQVQADTATTSVSVGNVAPAFVGGEEPHEDPVCHSGSGTSGTAGNPIDEGQSLAITARATDANGDEWYLVICDGESPPTAADDANCASGTTYGKSSLTTQGIAATATIATTGLSSESYTWYAYACDSSTGADKCSEMSNSGTVANSGTPFYVNHAPSFTNVSTTAPGGGHGNPGTTFTITTVSSDNDSAGGADTLTLYVCDTNATSGIGCETDHELCHTIGGASPDVSCDYNDTIPTVDQEYTYYAFVWDNHEFAGYSGDSQASTYTIDNVTPTISSVSLNGGNLIELALKGSTTNVVALSTDVYDSNGFEDITAGATAVIYLTSEGNSCSADNNNCYQIATGDCVQSAGVDATCTYTCTATFEYYADPTDGSSTWSTDTWSAEITAADEVGSGSKIGDAPVDVKTNTALDVTPGTIAYGPVPAGDDTGVDNQTTTVTNEGNSPIDNELYGTDMTKVLPDGTIEVGNQHYALIEFTYDTGDAALKLEASKDTVDIEATKPTSETPDVSDNILWGIGIPEGKASGSYTGTNTFSVLLDSDNWPSP